MKRFNLKPNNKLDIHFSMSSMTDIIFLLLIFFIITTSFETLEGIIIDLPKSHHSVEMNDNIRIIVNSRNEYILKNKVVSDIELTDMLKNIFVNIQNSPKIIIEADKNVPINSIVSITNIAKSISSRCRISIATRQ